MSIHRTAPGAFDAFAAEWRRVGMPGEPCDEGAAGASVAPPSWGVRLYYELTAGADVLRALAAGIAADDRGQSLVLRALDDDELPRAALVLTRPTHCPRCDGPLEEASEDRALLRCTACGERLRRTGQRWEPPPSTELGLRIEQMAAAYEALFGDIAQEPVDVSRSALDSSNPSLAATFTSLAGADLVVAASQRLRGLVLRKRRGRRVIFATASRARAGG